jgi:hypothetical protein
LIFFFTKGAGERIPLGKMFHDEKRAISSQLSVDHLRALTSVVTKKRKRKKTVRYYQNEERKERRNKIKKGGIYYY